MNMRINRASRQRHHLRFTQCGFCLLLGAGLVCSSGKLRGQELSNGDFEVPVLSPGDFGAPVHWAFSNGVFIVNGNPKPGVWPLAEEGQQFVDIGTNSQQSLSQDFAPGTNAFVITWYVNAPLAETKGVNYTVRLLTTQIGTSTSTTNFELTLDAARGGTWHENSLAVVGADPTKLLTLSFSPANNSSQPDVFLDNVTITPVPEPSLAALATLALALLLVRRALTRSPRLP
jgi:hypothetical protein